MGCANSKDDGEVVAQSLSPKASLRKVNTRYRMDTVSLSSNLSRLHDELDTRTVSHGSPASEPDVSQREGIWRSLVKRGAKHGIDADPDQFPQTSADVPEFRRRDRRRVQEWARSVDEETRASGGPAPIVEGCVAPCIVIECTDVPCGSVDSRGPFSATTEASEFELTVRSSTEGELSTRSRAERGISPRWTPSLIGVDPRDSASEVSTPVLRDEPPLPGSV